MMTKSQRQIAITTNRKGQQVAYYVGYDYRWFRMGLDAALVALATESARLVPFCSWRDGQPSAMNQVAR